MKYRILKWIKHKFKIKGNLTFDSKEYWEQRYSNKGNSGAGSYGNLAEWKAEFVNCFVKEKKINTVVDFGCGDGNQLKLANYPQYKGFDVSRIAVEHCKTIFAEDKTKSFFLLDLMKSSNSMKSDLALSMDVIYHLVEDTVFHNYMNLLFNSASQYVIIYSSNYEKKIAEHVKSRKFTDWIEKYKKDEFKLEFTVKNKFPFDENFPETTSISDFFIYKRVNKYKNERNF